MESLNKNLFGELLSHLSLSDIFRLKTASSSLRLKIEQVQPLVLKRETLRVFSPHLLNASSPFL